MKRLATLSAIVTGCALFANVHAQDTSPTLQKIKDTGVSSLGIRESSVPFSYYDSQQHTIGYSQEIALRIVDEVKKGTEAQQADCQGNADHFAEPRSDASERHD